MGVLLRELGIDKRALLPYDVSCCAVGRHGPIRVPLPGIERQAQYRLRTRDRLPGIGHDYLSRGDTVCNSGSHNGVVSAPVKVGLQSVLARHFSFVFFHSLVFGSRLRPSVV